MLQESEQPSLVFELSTHINCVEAVEDQQIDESHITFTPESFAAMKELCMELIKSYSVLRLDRSKFILNF